MNSFQSKQKDKLYVCITWSLEIALIRFMNLKARLTDSTTRISINLHEELVQLLVVETLAQHVAESFDELERRARNDSRVSTFDTNVCNDLPLSN